MKANKIFYLTKKGLERLNQENRDLQEQRKAKLGKTAPSAFYSEELNSEFVSFRDEMDALEAKLEETEYILKHHEIIKPPLPKDRGKVNLGAKVKVEINGQTDEFFIVGAYEANPALGMISKDSPVGMALMGKKAGEIVAVESLIKIEYKIKKITY